MKMADEIKYEKPEPETEQPEDVAPVEVIDYADSE